MYELWKGEAHNPYWCEDLLRHIQLLHVLLIHFSDPKDVVREGRSVVEDVLFRYVVY